MKNFVNKHLKSIIVTSLLIILSIGGYFYPKDDMTFGSSISRGTPKVDNLVLSEGSLIVGNSSGVGEANSDLFIDSSGNIGINDITPSYKLDVNGTSGLTGDVTLGAGLYLSDVYRTTWPTGTGTGAFIDTGTTAYYNGGNVGIGTTTPDQALDVIGKISLNDGGNSVFIGAGAGLNDDGTNNRNVGVGYKSLYSNTTGQRNTANGYYSLYSNTTGSYNTASGYLSLYSNTTGSQNTANGYFSLYSNTTGNNNTANGYNSLYFNTTGSYNSANGMYSLYSNTTGSYNFGLGYQSGRYIADGATANATGLYNTFIGSNTKALADGDTNEMVIGYGATGIGSNTVVLGNDSVVTTVLKGNVGIGTTSPTAVLHLKAGTATAGTAPLKFTSGVLQTVAEAGAVEYDGCRTYITNVATQRAIDRTSDVLLETVTVENTTTETTIWTGTMNANSLCAGNVFKFHANGLISSDSAGDLITIRIYVGASETPVATLVGAAKKLEDDHFHIDAVATQRTIGASGSRALHVDMTIDEVEYSLSAIATIDTTANMDVTITAQWNNADAGDVLELLQAFMEYKN